MAATYQLGTRNTSFFKDILNRHKKTKSQEPRRSISEPNVNHITQLEGINKNMTELHMKIIDTPPIAESISNQDFENIRNPNHLYNVSTDTSDSLSASNSSNKTRKKEADSSLARYKTRFKKLFS